VPKALVIVESPTKARTISKFLPKGFIVESSIGHIRDLPTSAREIPAAVKKEPWARLGIDIENDFQPLYVVPAEKKKQVAKLKALLKEASEVYLATDEDREGESISWHLCEVLKPKVPRRRLVFHEITREAIEEALKNPRDIDERLVQAQETRRILDRLYGYEISPLLWKKIAPRLSAGRVQSVAIRIIVERERQRLRFVEASYWDLGGIFETRSAERFSAVLAQLDGKRLASGKDFDETTGRLRPGLEGEVVLLGEAEARELAARLRRLSWRAVKVERRPYSTRPEPPFTTSTLQQEANRKLRMSARASMRAAQRLYENGHITYMRTDSVTLSEQAIVRAREVAARLYGPEYLSPEPRRYKTKVKNAQEAHEAIRPAAEFLRPEELRGKVSDEELRLYELIWKRTVACQMAEARGQRITIQAANEAGDAVNVPEAGSVPRALFQASGKTIDFPGFLRAYVEGADDPEAELADKETVLPDVKEGDSLTFAELEAKGHTTQPPPRYTEASLVKELEANGVGRPSTYATIIDTIQRREYVVKQGNALVPTFMAFAVVQLLERFFAKLIDVQFTATMENELDEISLGEKEHLPYLRSFYFGDGEEPGLHELIKSEIDPRESCTIHLGRDLAGREINIRVGRYGPYLERGEDRASIPEALAPDELTVEKAEELLSIGSGPQVLGTDPASGKAVYLKVGRYGPYVQLGENEEEPKLKSLLPGMEIDSVTLEAALKILGLPRSLGIDPESGEEVFADYGRYGPYVKRTTDSRSLTAEDDVFEVKLERALELFKQEKPGGGWRGRFQPKVLRPLGEHPDSKAPIQLLSGRYGPYVSDGEVNASLPRGADPARVTLEEAVELIRRRTEAVRSGRARKPPARRARKTAKKSAGAGAAKGGGEAAAAPKKAKKKRAKKKAAGKSA
jgi:DNA topoisomerase-1